MTNFFFIDQIFSPTVVISFWQCLRLGLFLFELAILIYQTIGLETEIYISSLDVVRIARFLNNLHQAYRFPNYFVVVSPEKNLCHHNNDVIQMHVTLRFISHCTDVHL